MPFQLRLHALNCERGDVSDMIDERAERITAAIGAPYPTPGETRRQMSDEPPGVRIDTAHANLLFGLVCAHKPARVLEFGFGGGRSAQAILDALEANGNDAQYLLVDNWADWCGVMPVEAFRFVTQHHRQGFQIMDIDEWTFVAQCDEQFDFIMSDADHFNTHRWFEDVYDRLLAPGGILVYHDCRNFPGIASITLACERERLRHVVFDKSSKSGEACERGLLVIFKPLE